MKASEKIEEIAKLLYKQAGYGELYVESFPNKAWDKIKDKSKEKWYWKARDILNLAMK